MAAVESQYAILAHNLSKSARIEAEAARTTYVPEEESVTIPRSDVIATEEESVTIPRGDVIATLNFFKAPEDGSTPFNYVETPVGRPTNNYGSTSHTVTIHDIRGHEDDYNLNKDAFTVIHNVPDSAEKDFTSDESIKEKYYPEVEKLLLENVPGSNRVYFFDITVRRPSSKGGNRGPVMKTHIDQTAGAARERVKYHLPSEAETLLQGRYRIINVWRPLNGPVVSTPLAFASSASVEDSDLTPVELIYPDRSGWTAGVSYNEGQKWNYLSGMRNDERLLLQCSDSEALKEGSEVLGGRVPHSAFVHPRTPAGAPERESIEVRTLVFGP